MAENGDRIAVGYLVVQLGRLRRGVSASERQDLTASVRAALMSARTIAK